MNNIEQEQARQKKIWKQKGVLISIIVAAILVIVLVSVSVFYQSHFYPHSTLNGIDISNMTLAEAQKTVEDTVEDYSIQVTDRDGNTYELQGTDFQMTYYDDGTLQDAISGQGALSWLGHLFGDNEIKQDCSDFYTTDALQTAILNLDCFDADKETAPTNAHLKASKKKECFVIVKETQGNTLIQETAISAITDAVNSCADQVTLSDDCYETPTLTSEDETLKAALETANSYVNATITYDITDSDESIDADTIMSWVVIDEDNNVSLDEDAITDYVQTLATKYNTYGDEREFKTTEGDTVTIGGGDYGWVIDKEGEKAEIMTDLESGQPTQREPIYSQTAVQQGSDDIGDTYVEIDYTNQHLYYYVDGTLKLDTDIVSGNISLGNGSPDGVFKIVYKERDATLVGEDYSSAVDYFMPFAYNVGIHDASWRSEFGGTIYKTEGSHGCINVPASFAKKLYKLIEVGTPVIAYYRESVELTSNSSKVSNVYSYVEDDDSTD